MKPILTSHLGTKKSLLKMAGKAAFDPRPGATFLQCVLACDDNNTAVKRVKFAKVRRNTSKSRLLLSLSKV